MRHSWWSTPTLSRNPFSPIPIPMDGTITIQSCSQQGHAPQGICGGCPAASMNRIRAIQRTVGGSFGGKFEVVGLMSARAAMVTWRTGRPCKLTLTREQSIAESMKRHPFRSTIRIGATKDGRITAYEAAQVENCGAYNSQAPWMNIRPWCIPQAPMRFPTSAQTPTESLPTICTRVHSGATAPLRSFSPMR